MSNKPTCPYCGSDDTRPLSPANEYDCNVCGQDWCEDRFVEGGLRSTCAALEQQLAAANIQVERQRVLVRELNHLYGTDWWKAADYIELATAVLNYPSSNARITHEDFVAEAKSLRAENERLTEAQNDHNSTKVKLDKICAALGLNYDDKTDTWDDPVQAIQSLRERLAAVEPVSVADRLPTDDDGILLKVPLISEPVRYEERLCVEVWWKGDSTQWTPYPITDIENSVRTHERVHGNRSVYWRRIDNTPPEADREKTS